MERDALFAFWEAAIARDFAVTNAAVTGVVSEWCWSKGPTRWLLPLGRELEGEGRRLLRKPSAARPGHFEYGLDDAYELRIWRQYLDRGRGKPIGDWTTLVERTEDCVSWVEHGWAPTRKVRRAGRLVLRAGVPLEADVVSKHSHIQQRLHTDPLGRVTTVDCVRLEGWQQKRGSRRLEARWIYRAEYDDTGVTAVDDVRNGSSQAIFRRAVVATTEALIDELEQLLVNEVVERMRQLDLGEPAYDLAIVWNEAASAFPPAIAVGVVSERARLEAAGLASAPCEKLHFAPKALKLVGRRLVSVALELERRLSWPARIALLQRAAAKLDKLAWTEHLPVTADFAVYACDMWGTKKASP